MLQSLNLILEGLVESLWEECGTLRRGELAFEKEVGRGLLTTQPALSAKWLTAMTMPLWRLARPAAAEAHLEFHMGPDTCGRRS